VALDYGRSRIGVAVSDPTRTIASPHSTVPNADEPTEPPAALLRLLEELEATTVVLGIPLQMDGSAGEMAREVREFGRRLGEATGLPIVEWDERLTSAGAERTLRESGASRRKRRDKGSVDRLAAAMLLRAYLASDR
jgi:putative Holliday junction resolvase